MIRAIRDYHERTGFKVGYKPAGGISKAKDALVYLALMKDELGDRWLQPDLFRFGASSLLGDIERQLEHFVTGRYSAAYTGIRDADEGQLSILGRQPMNVRDIFETMDYGPAPESAAEALAWLARRPRQFGLFIDGAFTTPGKTFAARNPATGETARPGHASHAEGRRCRRQGRPHGPAAMGEARRPRPGAVALRAGPAGAEAIAPVRGAGNAGQRQADPREPRHRYPAGRPPLLLPRRHGRS